MNQTPNYHTPKPPTPDYTLARCPFCGDNEPSLEKPGDYQVRCWTCGTLSTDAPNADYVIWAWNRRVTTHTPVPKSLEYDLITHAIKEGVLPEPYRICQPQE